MRVNFARGLVHGGERRAGELELSAGLERNRRIAGHRGEPDDVLAFHDRFPAEEQAHALEQGADAALALVGHRIMAADRERELLVLGADAELGLRLGALLQPRNQLVARRDRRHVELVTGHWGVPAKGPRTYTRAAPQGNVRG